MSTNIANRTPFLRGTREFPEEIKELVVQINKTYVDVANAVNNRTISLFTVNKSVINGESWFVTQNQRQTAFRQIYTFEDPTTIIPHNIDFIAVERFVRIWGTFFDGTDWQVLPYVDVTSVTNQINISVDSTNINITKGAGAPPTITTGTIILEWLSLP